MLFHPRTPWILIVCLVATALPALAEKHQLAGVLKDQSGKPIEGVLVCLGPPPSLLQREENKFVQTDAQGAFAIPVTYPGEATLSCWHADYIAITDSVSTDDTIQWVLKRGAVLEGAVDWDDTLRGRAIAIASFPDQGYTEATRTDRSGKFRFANLPEGLCEIEVRAEDANRTRRIATAASVRLKGGTANDADLAPMPSSGSLEGTIRDAQGFPTLAQFTLHVEAEAGRYVETVRSDIRGEFHFANLPPGNGRLIVATAGSASEMLEIEIGEGRQTLPPMTLKEGMPLRCSLLNSPEGTRGIQVMVFFGKLARPAGSAAEIRALLDQPVAWSGVMRSKSEQMDILAPGSYTLLAFPLATTARDYTTYETAELLPLAPVYMDTFTVSKSSTGATVAAAFPKDERAAYAEAQAPLHPIIGTWAYEYRGSIWTRTFTRQGQCILAEGPLRGWTNRYVILGEQRVAVIIDGAQRIHALRPDGKLDVEGQFIATKVQ